jgi:ABC-type glutathione transport system ATPase component
MPVPDPQTLLSVRDLNIAFGQNLVPAVRNVSFDIGREKVGIVGESGSGKSTTGRAIMLSRSMGFHSWRPPSVICGRCGARIWH